LGGKILVTGASGLVGANLVRLLLDQGRQVRALVHHDRRALDGLDVEAVSADVRDQPSLEKAMLGVELVYHLAGSISLMMDSGRQVTAINQLGTRNVVAACLHSKVPRLMHFSSIEAVRQQPLDQPLDENRPLIDEVRTPGELKLIPPYDVSKAQGEREVRAGIAAGLDAVIIRPTAMLGPYDFKPSYLGQALIQLANGQIPALVRGGFNWVDVRDVAAGAIRAAQTASSGACYILGGHWHTIREVAGLAASFTRRAAPLIAVPLWLADLFAPIMLKLARLNGSQPIYTRVTLTALRANRTVSSARAAQELGYTSRPLEHTVRDALTWFQQRHYLNGDHP
jgi:dihydroflavonol-4-reductase